MKKILSLIMAVLMVASVFCVFVSAEDETDGEIVPLEVLSVEYFDESTLYLNWSGKVDNIYDPDCARTDGWCGWYSECGIAIVNNTTDWEIQTLGEEPLVWKGSMDYPNGWANGDVMSFKIGESYLGCSTIKDVLDLVNEGKKFEGCTVAWFIKELGTSTGGSGYVDVYFEQVDWSLPDATVNNWLQANYVAEDTDGSDIYYVALEDRYDRTTTEKKVTTAPETTKAAETTKAEEATTAADETTNAATEEKGSSFPVVPVVIGAVVLVAIVVVVVIIVSKKKK